MGLDFSQVPNTLFPRSERDNLGIGARHEGRIWSCAGTNFLPTQPDVHDVSYDPFLVTADQDNVIFCASVELPDGATINEVIVYGNAGATAESWFFDRVTHAGANSALATANIGTADTSITNEAIDNETYFYTIRTSSLDTNDTIHGARILYTF